METGSLILAADQYTQVSAYELLCAAEQGLVGLDHRFLHALVDDADKSIADLVRFGLEERAGAREDLGEDLVQIFRHLRRPEAIPYLLECLRRNHLDATIPLICAFQEIGAAAVEPLLAFYAESGSEEDSDAGFLLGSLGVRDPRILEALLARIDNDPVEGGHCLAAYGDPAAIPALRAALAKIQDEEWMARSLESSLSEIEAGSSSREDEPFDLWELYPAETDPRFDLLTEAETEWFLDSTEPDNRYAAVSVLSEQGTPKRLWDRLLRIAREDASPVVRGECWQALVDGWERADIRQAIRACVADESAPPEERSGALIAMANRDGGNAETQRFILHFYAAAETRAKALAAMAISQEPRFAEYFRKHLDDLDTGLCMQAMLGVATLGLESDAPRLVPYFKDEDLRSEALPCYAMSAPAEPSRAGLRRLFRKIDEMAGGLSLDEESAVKDALNTRAGQDDLDPVYGPDGEELIDKPVAIQAKIGRNDPCPCGSGKKYKKCCGG